MGSYDYVGQIQVKAGPCEFNRYGVGDEVPFSDGIYLAYEGAFAVKDGKLVYVAETEYSEEGAVVKPAPIFDKWGGELDLPGLIENRNPIAQALQKMQTDL